MDWKLSHIYDVVKEESLDDIQSEGFLFRHKKSGARVVFIKNTDENKVFYIGFRTPVSDSTGVPHIMEHSVLCGSRDFPVKDPFVELVKGSLNTFLNAMTYPDKTIYPVASCNQKDFENLMHVYMDAVFYPNIYQHEEIFRQEGWDFQLDKKEGPLQISGVVYNEMKGVFSSPEGVMDRVIFNSLFPDTGYGFESGGDPEVIPQLTYEAFLDFHRTYYHPSNSYIYLYGDMDMEERLEWLDQAYLSHFENQPVDSVVMLQKPFEKMKELEVPYSIGKEDEEKNQTYLSYNKVIDTALNDKLYLAFQILDYALLSAPGAPLKKALIDAGIGKDILGSYDNGVYQPTFSIVAKNANREQKEEFVKVIEGTLKDLVEHGIDKASLEGGINYFEFRYREADFGNYPKGLMYGLQLLDSWLYDDKEPFVHVKELETFRFLKEELDKGYFEQLIQTYLLSNQHGSLVTVVPEKGRTTRLDKQLADALEEKRKAFSEEELEKLVERTGNLRKYQEEPSSQEDLKKIPMLSIKDLNPQPAPVYNEEFMMEDTRVLFHEVGTNGIGYLTLLFSMEDLEEEEYVYAGILQAVLGMIDTKEHLYGELFNEINGKTGGISTSLEMYADHSSEGKGVYYPTLEIKGKALYPQIPFLLEKMREILLESKLDDKKRLKEILDVIVSRLQMRFLSAGHSTGVLRGMSYASKNAKIKDLSGGIAYYWKVKELQESFDEKKDELVLSLQNLSEKIFGKGIFLTSYTAEKEGLKSFEEGLKEVGKDFLTGKKEWKFRGTSFDEISCEKKNEGFMTESKVQYVARTGNFMEKGFAYTGALQILKVILSYDYLWNEVRVKGGAYGCMSGFNRLGEGYFVSYRDPKLKETNEIYQGIVDYLKKFSIEDRDMVKFIIGTMSGVEQPLTPSAKGTRSLNLYLNHISMEQLKKERMEILQATQQDIRDLSEVVEAILSSDQICVIGNEDVVQKAEDLFLEVKNLI